MPSAARQATINFWNHVAEQIPGSVLTMNKEDLLGAGLEESHLLLGGYGHDRGRLQHTGTICIPNNNNAVAKQFLNLYRQYLYRGAELDVVERPTPEFYLYFDVDWKIPTDCAEELLEFAVHMAKKTGIDTATHRFKMGSEARWRSGQCGPIEEYVDHLVSLSVARRLQSIAKQFFPELGDTSDAWYVAVAGVDDFAKTWRMARNRPAAAREKAKETTKIGIHVHFPNLLVTTEQARQIRAFAVRDFCVTFGEVPKGVILVKSHTTGSFWDEAIDDSVYDSGLRMLKSMKMMHDRSKGYDHTRVYDMTMLLDGKTGMDNRSRFAIEGSRDTRFRKCSIRCADIITKRDKEGKKVTLTRHERMLALGFKLPELYVGMEKPVAPITAKAFRSMFGEDKLARIKRKHIEMGFEEDEAATRAGYEMEMHHANHMFAGGVLTAKGKRAKTGTVKGKVTTLFEGDPRYAFAIEFVKEHMQELHPGFNPIKVRLTGVRLYKSSTRYHDLQVQTDSRLCMNRVKCHRGHNVPGLGEHENRRSASLYFVISKSSQSNTKLYFRQGCYSQSNEPNQRRFGMECTRWCTTKASDPVAHIIPVDVPARVGEEMFPDCQPQ